MGRRPTGETHLLAQWVGRNRKVNHHPDLYRNDLQSRNPRRQFLLLPGLPRPKGIKEHLPHACLPARTPVSCVSRSHHSDHQAGPVRGPKFTHISAQGLDYRPPYLYQHFVHHRRGCSRRVRCDQPSSAILSILGCHVKHLSFIKFFITGRPEPRIRSGFRLPLLESLTEIFLLHEVEPSSVDDDILLYLQEKLTEVAKQRSNFGISDTWPRDKDLAALTKK
jgi:hypothetical protein